MQTSSVSLIRLALRIASVPARAYRADGRLANLHRVASGLDVWYHVALQVHARHGMDVRLCAGKARQGKACLPRLARPEVRRAG